MTKELTFFQKVLRLPFWPFRHWRISIPVSLILFAACIVYLNAQKKQRREVIEAANFATTFEEMNLAQFSPEMNAAPIYLELASGVVYPNVSEKQFGDIRKRFKNELREKHQAGFTSEADDYSMPLSEEERGMIEQFLEDNGSLFERFEDALTLQGCQFGDYAQHADMLTAPEVSPNGLSAVRQLARFASLKSMWALSEGDMEEAIRWNVAGLKVANQLVNDPLLIAGLVRAAVTGIMVADIPLLVSAEGTGAEIWKPLVEQLIPLSDRSNSSIFIKGEMCFMIGYTNAMAPQRNFLTNALFTGPQQAYIADVIIPLMQAMDDPQIWFYEYYKNLERDLENRRRAFLPGHVLMQTLAPALVRSNEAFDRQHARAQQGLISIGLQRYRSRNGGYPDQLESLVPDFLETVPDDPFSNLPYVYRKSGDGYTLYSFGQDGDDDGGSATESREGDLVWKVGN
jgi:hypothetical protein